MKARIIASMEFRYCKLRILYKLIEYIVRCMRLRQDEDVVMNYIFYFF